MIFIRRLSARLASLAFLACGIGLSGSSHAGAITAGSFLQFAFSDVGIAATGCNPADPAGGFCLSSSGTPSAFLDAPP